MLVVNKSLLKLTACLSLIYILLISGEVGGNISKRVDLQQVDLYHVIEVIDGDTIKVQGPEPQMKKIRLYGVDCPELDQGYGKDARVYTMLMSIDKYLQIIPKNHYNYNRLVAEVILPDGRSLNRLLVKVGLPGGIENTLQMTKI